MDIEFTNHALSRIKRRKMTHEDVIQTIKYPEILHKQYGLFFYSRRYAYGIIEACCERAENHIKVVTVYWGKPWK